jgi:hypothetical protein
MIGPWRFHRDQVKRGRSTIGGRECRVASSFWGGLDGRPLPASYMAHSVQPQFGLGTPPSTGPRTTTSGRMQPT